MSLPVVGDPVLQRVRNVLLLDKDPTKILLNKYLNLVYSVSALDLKCRQVNASSSGANTFIEAVPHYSIRVFAFLCVAQGDVDVNIYTQYADGTTEYLVREVSMPDDGYGWSESVSPPAYLFSSGIGKAIYLELDAAVQIGGHASYW